MAKMISLKRTNITEVLASSFAVSVVLGFETSHIFTVTGILSS